MKKTSVILASVLALCMALPAFAACNRENEYGEEVNKNMSQIYVSNYDGGVGTDWLYSVKERFEAAYADEHFEEGKTGVQVMINPVRTKASGLSLASAYEDVFFSEEVVYNDFVSQGLLMDISDVVEDVLAQDGVSIGQDFATALTAYDGNYYALPHYEVYGVVTYNKDIFNDYYLYFDSKGGFTNNQGDLSAGPDGVKPSADDGLPTTIVEFMNLCAQMKSVGVTPFILTGAYANTYDTIFLDTILGAYSGKDALTSTITLEGQNISVVDTVTEDPASPIGYTLTTKKVDITEENGYEIYNLPGKFYALSIFKKILENSWLDEDALYGTVSQIDAQEDFIRSEQDGTPIAMLMEGSWWENESNDTFESLVNMGYPEYSKENCHFGILPMPTKYDENDTNDVEPAYYNFYNSFAFAKKTNLAWKEELVKEFLRFCYTADELEAFTLQTGVARGLNYSIDETKLPSDFSEDVWAVHKSGNVVQQVSTSDIVNNNHNTFIMGRWKTNFANSVYSYFHTTPAATVKDYFDATKTSTMVTSIWGGQ